MIFVENFVKILKKNKVDFFTGVPDSILKNLSLYLENFSIKKHIIAANEGAAVSVGIGYYLSRKKIPCVYFQNSGLGNAINPLISIAHKEVYSIPLLLIIGWRGSPNQPDEPQHKAKGKITKNLLQLLKVKHCVLKSEKDLLKLKNLIKISYREKRIVACLIEKNSLKIKKVKKKK
jgi:phosphonopyruvate decarboxylase